MELFYILFVLLLAARLAGEVAHRLGQPALVGELVAGIALGLLVNHYSGAFPILAHVPENEVFTALTDLAIFFLMLLAGVEMHPGELAQASKRAVAVAAGGMVLPLALGIGLGLVFLPESELKHGQTLFLGTALAITAVPVSVKVLMDLGKLRSRVGQTIVSAAVFDDVLSLVLLAALTAAIKTGSLPGPASLALLAGKILLYFLIAYTIGRYVFPWVGRMLKTFHAQEFEFSALLVAALAYALLAEALGMHFIIGAFFAGLFFIRSTVDKEVYERIREGLNTFTHGLFGPIFFASIGLHLDLRAATDIPLMVILLIAIAFMGKLAGAGLPALWSGFSRREALGIGVGMSARGAVELVIADIALRAGLFAQPDPPPPVVAYLFSAVVIMALTTTLVAPLLLRRLL
jgi:Kef-type K+ transport system membrane component KefB